MDLKGFLNCAIFNGNIKTVKEQVDGKAVKRVSGWCELTCESIEIHSGVIW
tara:strand:- start:369 stop:521 length:153 start_codon:yes stop_codon:yes gene_type:complete